jgi:hypothetical protein
MLLSAALTSVQCSRRQPELQKEEILAAMIRPAAFLAL